jgi:hypothetical protein
MDNGPNCFHDKIDFKDLTRLSKAHEQINTKTKATNPSSDEAFVIFDRNFQCFFFFLTAETKTDMRVDTDCLNSLMYY